MAKSIVRIHSEQKESIIADAFTDNSRTFDSKRILKYTIDHIQFIISHTL